MCYSEDTICKVHLGVYTRKINTNKYKEEAILNMGKL